MDQLLEKIGQLFIIGFPGEAPPSRFLDFVCESQIGGIILFEENCPTHLQARENIERVQAFLPSAMPFVAVDQEGGRICRLRGAPAELSAPADYGKRNDLERFREDYSRSAVYMASLGVNLNLAPVADILLQLDNQCLKGRCFGDTPEQVALFVRAAVEISRSKGLYSCLKHFPGLGAATVDPHEATATVDYDRILWQQRERLPFEAGVKAGADLLMTTHVIAPRLDCEIVTGSSRVISQLARTELEFDGPIMTDDLTMKGAASLGSYGERAVKAFNAGHDLLLFGRDYEAAMQAYEHFVKGCRGGDVSAGRLEEALNRVAGLKFKLGRSVVH